MSETTYMIGCRICSAPVTTSFQPKAGVLCADCCKRQDEERKRKEEAAHLAAVEAARRKGWSAVCPPEFDEISRDRLPDARILDHALAWKYGPRGVLMHGPSGRGKTRVAYQVLKREYFYHNRTVAVIDAMSLLGYVATFTKDIGESLSWLTKQTTIDLLLLDDPFKSQLSPRVEEGLWIILDRRLSYQRPTLITTNDDAATLAARISQDRREPLLRRLKESFDIISCL